MADTLDALAVHPTLVRDDRIRLPDALRAYVQGATAALAGEPRPGRSTAGSAQPGRALDAPHLDTAYHLAVSHPAVSHPAASNPAGWADELARQAFAAFEQDRLDDARELIDAANRVDPVRGPRWQWIRSRIDARADPSLSPAPAAVAAATSSSPRSGRVASPMSAPPAAAATGAGDHPARGAENDSRADSVARADPPEGAGSQVRRSGLRRRPATAQRLRRRYPWLDERMARRRARRTPPKASVARKLAVVSSFSNCVPSVTM